jgi:hypothetical protein
MTTDLPILFALGALASAALASIAIWAPRRLPAKAAALACAAAFVPLGYQGFGDLMSRPKPVDLEWWLGQAEEATVVASRMREGSGLYLWLELDGVPEPRAYRLPWDRKTAEELQAALEEAQRQGGGAVRMRLPFEPTLDRDEPRFYALPQPAAPPKDEAAPAPEIYQQPGQDA